MKHTEFDRLGQEASGSADNPAHAPDQALQLKSLQGMVREQRRNRQGR